VWLLVVFAASLPHAGAEPPRPFAGEKTRLLLDRFRSCSTTVSLIRRPTRSEAAT